MCELCGAPTILDDSSVEELLKIPYAEGVNNIFYVYFIFLRDVKVVNTLHSSPVQNNSLDILLQWKIEIKETPLLIVKRDSNMDRMRVFYKKELLIIQKGKIERKMWNK